MSWNESVQACFYTSPSGPPESRTFNAALESCLFHWPNGTCELRAGSCALGACPTRCVAYNHNCPLYSLRYEPLARMLCPGFLDIFSGESFSGKSKFVLVLAMIHAHMLPASSCLTWCNTKLLRSFQARPTRLTLAAGRMLGSLVLASLVIRPLVACVFCAKAKPYQKAYISERVPLLEPLSTKRQQTLEVRHSAQIPFQVGTDGQDM